MTLAALKTVTPNLPADAHVAWLRPKADDRERLSFYLGENTPADFASLHHPFALGEGLAGCVWQDGQSAAHCPSQPFPKWRLRADCKNESYVCVAVGKPAGPGGVLGFGSNDRFETNPEQIRVLETFAAVLAAAVQPDTSPREEKTSGGTTPRRSAPRSRARGSR
jgi:GAF domain